MRIDEEKKFIDTFNKKFGSWILTDPNGVMISWLVKELDRAYRQGLQEGAQGAYDLMKTSQSLAREIENFKNSKS